MPEQDNFNTDLKPAPDATGESTAESQDTAFYDTFPEDLRHNPSIQKFNSVEDMARGYVAAQGLIGAHGSKIEVTPNLAPDARMEVFHRMGLPKEPTTYELKPTSGMSEEIGPGSPLIQHLAQTAHKIGILPDQAQALYTALGEQYTEIETKAKADGSLRVDTELQEKWGDQYESNIDKAVLAAEKLGIRGDINASMGTLSANMYVALMNVGEMLSEDTALGGTGTSGGASAESLQAEMKDMASEIYAEKDPAAQARLKSKYNELVKRFEKSKGLTGGMNFGNMTHMIPR